MRRCTNFTRNRRNLEANNAGNGPRRKLALSGQRSGTGGNERQKGKRREAEAARLFYCRVVRRGTVDKVGAVYAEVRLFLRE